MKRKSLKNNRAFLCVLMGLLLSVGMPFTAYAQEEKSGIVSVLTSQEKQYIEEKRVLKVAVLDDFHPISAKEEKSGAYHGLAVDFLRGFSEHTGLEIEYVPAGSYLEAIGMTEIGKADLAATVVSYSKELDDFQIQVSKPYLESQMMMLYEKRTDLSKLSGYAMAESKGYPVFTQNPAISHMAFKTPNDCLMAVRSGHADLMYCDIFTGTGYLNQYENRDLIPVPITEKTYFHFGVCQKDAAILLPLLDREIGKMSRKAVNDSLKYNQQNSVGSFTDFVYWYPFEIMGVVVVAAFLLVLVNRAYTRHRSRSSIAMHGHIKSYSLMADNFGEPGLRYDYLEDTLTVFGRFADHLALPAEIKNFRSYLEREEKDLSLTLEKFDQMLAEGLAGTSCEVELECRIRQGEWKHFSFVYSVIATEDGYQRPVCLVGCLINKEREYQEKQRLTYAGQHDNLTTLFNRSGAEAMSERAWRDGTVTKDDLLVIIDVDFFKQINDTYGHTCGDDVLLTVGRYLKQFFREKDILCRWGGDEFMLYLFGAGRYSGKIEERINNLQKAMAGYRYGDQPIPVTLSIGGAIMADRSREETFRLADENLYRVKRQGRDSACISWK